MCGIAGWVDFSQDLTTQRDLALGMTRTMACRGPDDEGLYLRPHVALGHRRLAVIDVEGGRQPMALDRAGRLTRDDAAAALAMVYSGESYNFRDLRTARGLATETASDTEVVLRLHAAHGGSADRDPRAVVEQLNGMFAYALWDARREELLLVRDRLGVKPLYWFRTAHGVLFGSEPKAVLAHPDVPRVTDAGGLRRLVSWVADPDHTGFAGLREVPPGHVVRVSREGAVVERYWSLTSSPHEQDVEGSVARVRELLEDTVERQLISDVPLCTLLSGGLDSSALTALAAEQLGRAGHGPVRSFSVDPGEAEEGFVATELRGTPDGPYIQEVAEHVGSAHRDVALDDRDLLDPDVLALVLRARDLPSMGEMDTSLLLLFRAVREDSTVALSGESADEVFGGYKEFHDPAALGAGTFPWLAGSMSRSHGQLSDLLVEPVRKAIDLEHATADAYATALSEVPRLPGETGHDARMREVSYLYLTRFLPNLLERKDRMSMAVGLEVRVPFCDHRLVEYVFNAPWSLKTYDGREKSLLRGATRHLLPESVVQRVKSPYPSTQDPAFERAVRRDLARVAADPSQPVHDLLDQDRVRDLLDGDSASARHVAEHLLSLNAWLDRYEVSVDV